MRNLLLVVLILGGALSCSPAKEERNPSDEPAIESSSVETSNDSFAPNNYSDLNAWLCHPDKGEDLCSVDLTATKILADGTTEIIPHVNATEPAFDCFYVYPTVSRDKTPNSDMNAGPEERNVIANQFARYGASCRLYAPMYRQVTVPELQKMLVTGKSTANTKMAYGDVKDSWETYLRDHNNGRGVILVGHSQGARMIFELLKQELLVSSARNQIIAVHAIGAPATMDVETGKWNDLALCKSSTDTDCLISYGTFRSTSPPPLDAIYGRASEGERGICVDPAALRGGKQPDAYLSSHLITGDIYNYGAEVNTKFVKVPELLSASCESNQTHDWLDITILADPNDPRTDDIPGDVVALGQVQKNWGLHLIDVNLFMGDLVDLARTQGEAWVANN